MSEEITSLHDFLGKHPMYHRTLAHLLGVTTSAVDKWSNGDRAITARTLNQLNTLHDRFIKEPKIREQFVKTTSTLCAVS